MSTYRTGNDPLNKEQESIMEKEVNEALDEILTPTQEGSPEPEPQQEDIKIEAEEQKNDDKVAEPSGDQRKPSGVANPLEDIETAVLLVVNSHGNVLPVVQIENLNMKRIATPREVYRICLDAADQLSSVSLLGEMTGIYSTIAKEQGKLIAQNMAHLLIKMQQPKEKGPS